MIRVASGMIVKIQTQRVSNNIVELKKKWQIGQIFDPALQLRHRNHLPMIAGLLSCGLVHALSGCARCLRDLIRDHTHVQLSPPYRNAHDLQKCHDSLNHKWMRPKRIRNVGTIRAMLTRKDSEWKGTFEEPLQLRLHLWRRVGHVLLQHHVKGLAKSL